MNAIIRREPLGSLFEDLFSDYLGRSPWAVTARAATTPIATRARMDVLDKGDRYLVTVDLPGAKKEDIKIAVDGAHVSISAEMVSQSETKNGDQLVHSERIATGYARAFELPVEVTEQGAEAGFENGVLRLTLPKRAQVAARQIKVH
jgi:HSP20 family protein